MNELSRLSYALSRVYRASHRAHCATSLDDSACAARWAGAWNAFIQLKLERLRGQPPAPSACHAIRIAEHDRRASQRGASDRRTLH